MKKTVIQVASVLLAIGLTACAYSTKGNPGQPGKPGEPRPVEDSRPEPAEDKAD